MDAYLSQEAYNFLKALSIVSSSSYSDGLLIGHKRGHRYFVEKIFPSLPGFFPSIKNYISLDEHLKGKLLGFFSFNPNKEKLEKILSPYAFGKLFLQINLNQQKKMTIKSYLIEYDEGFFLSPLELKSHE